MKTVSMSSGTLEKMKSITQKPVGPVPHDVKGVVHTVASKGDERTVAMRKGTVRHMPTKEKTHRKAFQRAKGMRRSNGILFFMTY